MEPKITHYLCIGCPLGCRLEVEEREDEPVEVRGFACKRGKEYALQEHTEPRRMVTTTVQVENGLWSRLPVKSSGPVLKGDVLPICEALRQVAIPAPVRMGQVILPNILGSGIDIIATRDMPGIGD
jgi:CxxC motif-containing protein